MIDSTLGLLGAAEHMDPTRIDKLARQLEKNLKENPNDLQSWLMLGNGYYLQGKIKMAIATFEKAINVSPHYPYFHYYLGICFYRSARIDEAIVSLKKVVDLSPTLIMVNYWLGIAYFHKGAYIESRGSFESLLRDNSESFIAHYHAALACIAGQDLDGARTHLESLVKLGNSDPQVYLNLGSVYFRLNKLDDAIASYRTGLEKNPGNIALQKELSYLTEVPSI
jgi:tetratricopeptide (TPR) repeat protein